MHKLTLLCLLLQSFFIFEAVDCVKNESKQKSVQIPCRPSLATNFIHGGFSIAKELLVFTAVQVKGCIFAGKAIHNAIQTYKDTGNMTLAAQKSTSDLKSAIDIFMGIPGVKLSIALLNEFKNKGGLRTIFMNGGRQTIDMLPFGKLARLKAVATIQAVKDFNEAFQKALAEESSVEKVEEKPNISKTKQKEEPLPNSAVDEASNNDEKENPESIEDRELMMAMTGLGAIQAIQEGDSIKEVITEGIEGTLIEKAYKSPPVLDLIAYFENKDKENSKSTKEQATNIRLAKPAH